MQLRTPSLRARLILQALLLFCATPRGYGEYRTPNLPELSKFSAVAPEPVPSRDALGAIRPNGAPVSPGFKPPGNSPFQDFHAVAPGPTGAAGAVGARDEAIDT